MGKNTTRSSTTTKYGPLLVLIAGALVTPFLAFNWMGLELFSVSKTTFTILFYSSIKPWLCPPYVYLLINFIIFFIAASSSIRSFNPQTTHEFLTDDNSFTPSSLACQSPAPGSSVDGDHGKFDTSSEDVFKDPDIINGDDGRLKNKVVQSGSGKELRKSKTFQEGGSGRSRRERYVRILSQEELDRQVEAFIYRCKQDTDFQRS